MYIKPAQISFLFKHNTASTLLELKSRAECVDPSLKLHTGGTTFYNVSFHVFFSEEQTTICWAF